MKGNRYISLYLPTWAIDLARIDLAKEQQRSISTDDSLREVHTTPILLVSKKSNQLLVARFCQQAANSGITEGTSLALAKALQSDAIVKPFNPLRDFKVLSKLSERAVKYTPLAGLDSELIKASKKQLLQKLSPLHNGLILNMTGTEKLYKKNSEPARTILRNLGKIGIGAKIGIAPTIGAAWALSRFSSKRFSIIDKNNLQRTLLNLPLAALRIEEETITALSELGIYSINELLNLPRKSLLKRFGYQLIKRMDQAFGHIQETIQIARQPDLFIAKEDFDTPLSRQESIKLAILNILEDLFRQLSSKQKLAGIFILSMTCLDPEFKTFIIKKEVSLKHSYKDFSKIASIIQPILENLSRLRSVATIQIQGVDLEDNRQLQSDFVAGTERLDINDSKNEMLNALCLKIGAEKIRETALHQSHIPERSFSYPVFNTCKGGSCKISNAHLPNRPFYILEDPEAIEAIALMPDNPPAWIKWKQEKHRIVKATGPERISDEWWLNLLSESISERDYFKVQDQAGRWLWVFRERNSSKWFLHGVWS